MERSKKKKKKKGVLVIPSSNICLQIEVDGKIKNDKK